MALGEGAMDQNKCQPARWMVEEVQGYASRPVSTSNTDACTRRMSADEDEVSGDYRAQEGE